MSNINRTLNKVNELFKPPPKLTVSEWADKERMLSSESSAEPGRWKTDRAPYQRGMLDAVNDSQIEKIVIMTSSQVGKTEIINNIVGYFISHDPSPILLLQPTLEMAQTYSKDRLTPMLRDTKCLRGKVSDFKSRSAGNTMLHKTFEGGHITMSGANSPASLASRPIRILLCDEIDRYPISAGTEGDPVNLAIKRTTTFWNRKIILVSTPTIKGQSRIELAFNDSDQRKYYVPCPHCGEYQTLTWGFVTWPEGEPEKAAIACAHCGSLWSEADRINALKKGYWKAENKFNGTAGFYLNELYSPWSTPSRMAIDFLHAQNDVELLKTWTNTAMAETWEETGEQADSHVLMDYLESFDRHDTDREIVLVTAGADVQADRIEISVVGWDKKGRPWVIAHDIFIGDTIHTQVWNEFDDYLKGSFCGKKIKRCFIDSGHNTTIVYRFTKKRYRRGIFSIKGDAGVKEPASKPRETGSIRVILYRIGVDSVKRTLLGYLKEPGELIHFSQTLTEEYFLQLTAEKMVQKKVRGFARTEFIKTRSRNEALDTFVYAYAAMFTLHPDFERIKTGQAPKVEPEPEPNFKRPIDRAFHTRKKSGRSSGFVSGFKRLGY